MTAWFLLDLTRSMTFGPTGPAQAVDSHRLCGNPRTPPNARTAIAWAPSSITTASRVQSRRWQDAIRCCASRASLARTADSRPPSAPGITTNLSTLLDAGLNTFKRRSVVFVISDFISDPGWERPLSLLYRRHELISVRLWDPREVELPDAGLLVVEDVETGEHLYVDTSDAGFRRRFAERGPTPHGDAQRQHQTLRSRSFFDLHRRRPDWCDRTHGYAAQEAASMSQYVTFIWPWMLLSLLGRILMVWYYVRLRQRQQQSQRRSGSASPGAEPYRKRARTATPCTAHPVCGRLDTSPHLPGPSTSDGQRCRAFRVR